MKIYITIIIVIISFRLTFQLEAQSQNGSNIKKQTISQILSNNLNRIDNNNPYQLLYGNTEFSFDKLYLFNESLVICYDKQKAVFILLDVSKQEIIDKLWIENIEGIKKIKKSQEIFFAQDYFETFRNFGKDINYYFTSYSNKYSFNKINDSVCSVGFFNFYETKNNKNQQLQIGVSNNKLFSKVMTFSNELYSDLGKLKSHYSNITDFSQGFSFQDNEFIYSLYHPFKGSGYKTGRYIFLLQNNKLQIIHKEENINKQKKTYNHKYGHYRFLEYNNYLLQYEKDTLIIWDKYMHQILSKSYSNIRTMDVFESRYYIDAKTNEIYRVLGYKYKNEKYIYDISIGEFNKDKIEFREYKTIFSNKIIFHKGIIEHKLVLTNRNPFYNTDYIYICDFARFKDSVQLEFRYYNEHPFLKYQKLISSYQQNKYSYDQLNNKIINSLPINENINKTSIKNKSKKQLFISVKKLIENKSYHTLIKKFLVFEENDILAYSYYKNQNIIPYFKNVINSEFIALIKKDIDELINDSENVYAFSNNLTFYKSSSGLFYTVVNINNKYYLKASIGYESVIKEIDKEKIEFKQRYKYLLFREPHLSTMTVSFFFNDSSIIALPLNSKLSNYFFPNILENSDKYSQRSIKKLFESLEKCFEENNLKYVKSKLIIYPKDFIDRLQNENLSSPFLNNSVTTEKEIVSLYLKNTYKRKRLSKNISAIQFKLSDGNKYEILVIRYHKKWYLYPTIIYKNRINN